MRSHVYRSSACTEISSRGEWVEGARVRQTINPSDTRDIIGEFALSDREQTRAAVAAACDAFQGWYGSSPQQRFDVLDAAGTEILARRNELGDLLAREEGKTLPEAIGDVVRAGNIFKFFAVEALRTIVNVSIIAPSRRQRPAHVAPMARGTRARQVVSEPSIEWTLP